MTVNTEATVDPIAANELLVKHKPVSLWRDAMHRLIRNRAAVMGGIIIIFLYLMAIFAPLIAPYPYDQQKLVDRNKAPAWMLTVFPTINPYAQISIKYPVGADYVGRDLLSRIIYGARISLSIALIGPIISLLSASFMAACLAFLAAGQTIL